MIERKISKVAVGGRRINAKQVSASTNKFKPGKGGDVGALGMCACAPEESAVNINRINKLNKIKRF